MTLSKAGRIINGDEFLGKTWDWVMGITNPMMFPDRVIEAHKGVDTMMTPWYVYGGNW